MCYIDDDDEEEYYPPIPTLRGDSDFKVLYKKDGFSSSS